MLILISKQKSKVFLVFGGVRVSFKGRSYSFSFPKPTTVFLIRIQVFFKGEPLLRIYGKSYKIPIKL